MVGFFLHLSIKPTVCWQMFDLDPFLFSRHGIVWSSGGSNLLNMEPPTSKQTSASSPGGDLEISDIGVIMQSRAKSGYAGIVVLNIFVGNIVLFYIYFPSGIRTMQPSTGSDTLYCRS